MKDVGLLIYLLIDVCVVSGLFWYMSRIGSGTRDDQPFMLVGIRTAATTRSADAWYAAHQAAKRACRLTSQALLVVAVLGTAVFVIFRPTLGLLTLGLGTLFCLVIGGSVAAVVGHRAARETL